MSADVVVEVDTGLLRGQASVGVAAFKGIPYGSAVGGQRRWRRASPAVAWTGVKDASDHGRRAIQTESHEHAVTSTELEALMGAGGPSHDRWHAQSEECLTLSVWAPDVSASRKLPVMFWCHGGKYFGEVPPVWWFEGENLARSGDVVVVTVRHRVGALGFLHLADLPGGSEYADATNLGMLDLVAALGWVKRNIESFGGDPDNVTIFGESGGGLKVSVLLAMPDAEGLFHKAIVQSGAQLQAFTREEGTKTAVALMDEIGLGAHELSKLFDLPSEDLLDAQRRMIPRLLSPLNRSGFVGFEPVIDGTVLPAHPFDPAAPWASADVPLIVGTCATETTFFMSSIPGVFELSHERMCEMVRRSAGPHAGHILETYQRTRPEATPTDLFFAITSDLLMRRKAIRMAELKMAQARAPVYMYVLDFKTDVHGGKYRTPHVLDVPLVFAHPNHPILGSDPARHRVSRQMSGAWAAFAHKGHPATGLLPFWPEYDAAGRATMYFDAQPHLEFDPQAEERAAW